MVEKKRQAPDGFGLIIIGTEILDGRKEDSHFHVGRLLLHQRNIPLKYSMILPDDPRLLQSQLTWAMAREEPFFCCGGIGATPDDYTRQCAAAAAGVPVELHPEAVEILKRRFGKEATAPRLRMVEFPRGAALVPNPINQVPGFAIGGGYFLPGFPQMAAPMMEWVLDTLYEKGEKRIARKIVLPGCREADLVDLMVQFMSDHPAIGFSSLPHFTESGTEVHLGVEGLPAEVEEALQDLLEMLDQIGVPYDPPQ